MKQFFAHVKNSIYNPAYYQELLAKPFSFSLKYYLALAFLVTLFLTIVSAVPLVPLTERAVRDFPTKFFYYYPDELEVRVEKGVVTSSVTEPYFLPLPEVMKGEMGEVGAVESLLVIDTKTPFSLDQFKAYKAGAWLLARQLVMYDQNGSMQITEISSNSNLVVNETVLRGLEAEFRPYYKIVSPLLVLAIFVGLLVAFSVNFIYLIFGALLILLLGRVMKQQFTYGTAYRIGLHAVTLPLLINALVTLVDLPFVNLPFLYTLIMLFIVYLNFKSPVVVPATPSLEAAPTAPEQVS